MDETQWRRCMDGLEALTPRERTVVELVAGGETNGAICRALSLSPKTVGTHLTRIYAKLGLRPHRDTNRRVIVALAFARVGSGNPDETPLAWRVRWHPPSAIEKQPGGRRNSLTSAIRSRRAGSPSGR